MAEVSRGSADGVEGTWMSKEGVGDEKKLAFLQDTEGEPTLRLELDSKEIIGIYPDEADAPSYKVIYLRHESASSSAEEPSARCVVAKGLPPGTIHAFGIKKTMSVLHAQDTQNLVIISIGSGTKQAATFSVSAVRPTLANLDLSSSAKFHTTTSADTIAELTRSTILPMANEGISQNVVLLSGDGGTIDVVNTLYGSNKSPKYKPPTLITLPLGTGNALSNSYKYNSDHTWGLATLVRGTTRPLPTFRVTFSPGARLVVNEGKEDRELIEQDGRPTMFGVVVCSWGLHASLVADSDTAHYRQFGAERFQMVAKELLFPSDGTTHHSYKGTVKVKDPYSKEWEETGGTEHSYVLATLVSNLEKTFTISPDSKTLDGMMRLIRVSATDGTHLMKVMEAAYQDGKHVSMEGVAYREIDGLRIDFAEEEDRWRRVCIDGKIVKTHISTIAVSAGFAAMLLVHQAGSVHVGDVVRYTLTYTPSADRILPSPTHLHVKVKNTSPIPLRAAYLHGPYSLHVSAYPSTFNPHQKVASPPATGVPEFEPFLKAGAHWTCKLTIPEEIRETGATFAGRGSMDSMTQAGMEKEKKSVTWIVEVASQVIFSTSAAVHFEVLVGRDERSLELGFAAVAGHGHGGPGQVQDHKKAARERKRASMKGVYSRAVKLVVEDTEDLWDKPKLPQDVRRERPRSQGGDDGEKRDGEAKEKKDKKQKVHLVVLTHGLHSNLNADMLYMKESIDATVAQARADARERSAKRKADREGRSQSKSFQGTDDVKQDEQAATEALTGGQEELEDDEDEEQVVVRGFNGNAVRTERGIQYLGKRLAKYVLHLTYPSQPYLPIKKTMSQSISSKFGGSQDSKVSERCPPSHQGSTIHHDAEHPNENNQAYQFTSISFIGHSLGGLVQLYAIAYIQKHAPSFFKRIKPVNFVCMASPLLGLSNENPMYVKFALDFGLVGRTGQDLGLTWRAPTLAKSGWSAMGGVFGAGQKEQKEEDPGAKPLLRILPTGPAHQVLHLFRNRTLYSNVVNDGIVPLRTSCLLFLDWKGLGKVDKFRRENGLIGTMVEWGWAEMTGANADRDNSVSPRPNSREFEDSGSNTPTRAGHGETVPQPSETATEEDNTASNVLGPTMGKYLQPRTHNDDNKSSVQESTGPKSASPQQNSNTSSVLNDIWNFFKPAASQTTEKKSPKSVKAIQRAQTLTQEQEEAAAASDSRPSVSRGTTDNPTMRPTKSRPLASRGDSMEHQTSSLAAPPKTSVFEAASDILHPPVPSTQWIIDPSSRPRTIFHDRVYHPSDIPPPPTRRPSRLARSSSSSEQNSSDLRTTPGKSPSLRSTDSNASLNSDQGGMKVEEKIARAYHRDLSWRKVLVKLEPDAHNNMIVRRMFANAYGWPVVKHLCDTHFGDTFSAKTRDEDEPSYDRANVDGRPEKSTGNESEVVAVPNDGETIPLKKKSGEEVAGQTARGGLVTRESELREGRDELGSLDRSAAEIEAIESKHRHDTAAEAWADHFFSGSESDDDDGVYRADGRVGVSFMEASPEKERKRKEKPKMHLLHTGASVPGDGKQRSPDIILSPSEIEGHLTAEPESLSGSERASPVVQAEVGSEPLGSPIDVGLKKDINAAMTDGLDKSEGRDPGIVERVVEATASIEGQAAQGQDNEHT
ncbi:hypothetical protein CAC42_3295 [Sphaceloma murrayae]|uniref:DAGKc domain-containing protein n=1 Tax=Sphaceloma murrayae TaxID=2082308 RepID=A0A2K1QG06_9PEZI|nr:hypothetical protein CAC42_3295 [Sphaceloma murrayae]